jgi:hypothetical protein
MTNNAAAWNRAGELTNIGEVIKTGDRVSPCESSIAEARDEGRQVCINDGGRSV